MEHETGLLIRYIKGGINQLQMGEGGGTSLRIHNLKHIIRKLLFCIYTRRRY